jgi:hypothetical protein
VPAHLRGSDRADRAATSTASRKWEERSWWSRAATTAENVRFAVGEEERPAQTSLLSEVIGFLPFRPVTLDPAWQTPTVLSLAQAAYEERLLHSGELGPVRLNVLADALEDAGCTDEALLTHLREPGPHVRGCWALDLVLGKA